jgi:hypothetical protein
MEAMRSRYVWTVAEARVVSIFPADSAKHSASKFRPSYDRVRSGSSSKCWERNVTATLDIRAGAPPTKNDDRLFDTVWGRVENSLGKSAYDSASAWARESAFDRAHNAP